MMGDTQFSPASITSAPRYAPYNSSIAASASTSTSSVWSDASQSSDDTSVSAHSSDSESCDSYCLPKPTAAIAGNAPDYRRAALQQQQQLRTDAVPVELRQNPRRSSSGPRSGCPPTLVRQSDRKVNFVDSLVGRSKQTNISKKNEF